MIVINLIIKARLHGKKICVSFVAAAIDAVILLALLYWGGFFS